MSEQEHPYLARNLALAGLALTLIALGIESLPGNQYMGGPILIGLSYFVVDGAFYLFSS